MKVRVVIHQAEEGGYWAEVPALPGCFTQGETLREVRERIKEAIACHLDSVKAKPGRRARVEEVDV